MANQNQLNILLESINQFLCYIYFLRKELIISKNKHHTEEILKDFTSQFINFPNDGLLECVENLEKFDIKKFKNISSINLLKFLVNSVVTLINYSIPLLIIYFIGLEAIKVPKIIQPIYNVVKTFSHTITLKMTVLIINNLGGIIDIAFIILVRLRRERQANGTGFSSFRSSVFGVRCSE